MNYYGQQIEGRLETESASTIHYDLRFWMDVVRRHLFYDVDSVGEKTSNSSNSARNKVLFDLLLDGRTSRLLIRKIRLYPFMCVLFAVVGQHLCHFNIFLGCGHAAKALARTGENVGNYPSRFRDFCPPFPADHVERQSNHYKLAASKRASSSFNRPLRICVRSRKTQRVSLASPCLSCFTPMLLLQSESCSLRRSMQWIEAS